MSKQRFSKEYQEAFSILNNTIDALLSCKEQGLSTIDEALRLAREEKAEIEYRLGLEKLIKANC